MSRYTVRVEYLAAEEYTSLPTRTRSKTYRFVRARSAQEAGAMIFKRFRDWTVEQNLYPVLGWHVVVADHGRPVFLANGDSEDFRRSRVGWKSVTRPA